MARFLRTIGLLFGLPLLLCVPQIRGCVMTNSPKFGQVIDAEGHGVAGAYVIALGHFQAGPVVHGSSNFYTYRFVTHTDDEGNYRIPGHWSWFGFPGTDARTEWMMLVLKPGYVAAGDEDALYASSASNKVPRSMWRNPSAFWLGIATRVSAIQLQPIPNASLEQQARYFGYMASLGWDIFEAPTTEEAEMRRRWSQYFLPQVCALDPSSEISWGLAAFAYNPLVVIRRLIELNAERTHKRDEESKLAGDICATLKENWSNR